MHALKSIVKLINCMRLLSGKESVLISEEGNEMCSVKIKREKFRGKIVAKGIPSLPNEIYIICLYCGCVNKGAPGGKVRVITRVCGILRRYYA